MLKSLIRLKLSSARTGQDVITRTDTDTAVYSFFHAKSTSLDWMELNEEFIIQVIFNPVSYSFH